MRLNCRTLGGPRRLREKVREFISSALECTAYLAPEEFGLSQGELLEVAGRVGFQKGEVLDSLDEAAELTDYETERYVPKHTGFWSQFHFAKEPELRNFRAFEFICVELQKLVRAEGIRNAALDRNAAIERALASGIPRTDTEAAIVILAHDKHIVYENGVIQFAPGREQWPLPSEQRAASSESTPKSQGNNN